jgi:hypothetical protein
VNCLAISANTAVVDGEILVGPQIYIGSGLMLLVIDNGTSAAGMPDVVQPALVPAPPDPASQCQLGGGTPSTSGNFTAHDAP